MTLHHPTYWRAGAGFVAGAAAVGLLLLIAPAPVDAAENPVVLKTAADYSVLAGSAVTNTGATTLGQSLGVHPGNAVTGFPPGIVGGQTHLADGAASQAKIDLTDAYLDAAGRTPIATLPAQLGGRTLTPGVYQIGAADLTGQLTLDSQNNPAAVFIFQVSSTLTTASNSTVVFVNGATPCNVFWQVTSSATLGTNSDFIGTVMALASITMTAGASLVGRALARNAVVTLDDNVITEPICAAVTTPPTTPATTPAATPTTGLPTGGPTGVPTTGAPTGAPTGLPTTGLPPTTAPPTDGPPGTVPPTSRPPTTGPPTAGPPTAGPPTTGPPTTGPPTTGPPTTGPPTTRPPTTRPPATRPPGARPPATSTHPPAGHPPRLPKTGSRSVPALSAAGIVLIALGSAMVFGYRKRRFEW